MKMLSLVSTAVALASNLFTFLLKLHPLCFPWFSIVEFSTSSQDLTLVVDFLVHEASEEEGRHAQEHRAHLLQISELFNGVSRLSKGAPLTRRVVQNRHREDTG